MGSRGSPFSELRAFPVFGIAQHSGLLERLESFSDDLFRQGSRETLDKLAKEIVALTNVSLALLGVAVGLMIFLASRVPG